MKTTTTAEQIGEIIKALAKINMRPFGRESGDSKYDAQRNLSGKTHYVDDDTLKFHHSRVLSTGILHSGLLLRVTCSDALDMNNTKRGCRAVVFDVFGTTISRPKLEEAKGTSHGAIKASEQETIDLVAHYTDALQSELRRRERETEELRAALDMMPAGSAVIA